MTLDRVELITKSVTHGKCFADLSVSSDPVGGISILNNKGSLGPDEHSARLELGLSTVKV